jgi:pyruvate dehydrogenase E1 component alpha subunit
MTPGNAYRALYTIRCVETRLQGYCDRGEAGDLHFNKGQEAVAVGVCSVLRGTDFVVTHHRTIAHAISKGARLHPLIAELLGKRTGYCQGRAGEMHISIPEIRYAFSFQLVGTCVPVATGLAWAQRYHHQTGDVVAVFLGDAAFSNGAVHEGLTIAAIREVPLLVVCENNSLAGNVRPSDYQPTRTVADRMAGYGIPSVTLDGTDVRKVAAIARDLVEEVRKESRPRMMECRVFRNCFHKQGQGDARPKAEIEEGAKRDPLFLARGRLGEAEATGIEMSVAIEVAAAFEQADKDEVAEWTE